MPDQTALDLDQVRDHLDQWQARTALPEAAADRAAHTLAAHVPALLDALTTARAEARAVRDATRRLDIKASTEHRQQLLAALGREDDGTTPLADYITALTSEHSVTLNTIGWKLAQALGDVPVGALQIDTNPVDNANRITRELAVTRRERDQARAAADSQTRRGYNSAIAILRGVHQRTGSPAAQWAAHYLTVDPDRESPAATVRTPADQVTDAMAQGAAAGLAALTAATPAVDHAHAQPAAPDGVWEYTDPDGASAVLYRHPDGWTLRSHDCVLLPPDAVASLHAWLSQQLGQPAPVATDDSPAEPAEELIEVHHIVRSR